MTHSTLNDIPRKLVFNQDILFYLKYIAYCNEIRRRKMQQVLKDNMRENSRRRDYTYKVGGKVLLKRDHLSILKKHISFTMDHSPFAR